MTPDTFDRELSVIVPVYNEEGNLEALHKRLTKVLADTGLDYEILFVNDGSRDHSMQMIKDLAVKDAHCRYIDLSRNFGHQIAVSAGLDHCRGKRTVIIDADLQDPPELIHEFLKKHKEGYEVVYARRRSRAGESWMKKFTARMFYRMLAKMTNVEIPVDVGDFRLIDHKVVQVLRQMPERQKYLRGQIAWVGFRQLAVEYDRDPRMAGKTGYTFRKMFRLALDGLTAFSNFPLRFASISGFVVSGLAFLFSIYALVARFILHSFVPGWASLMISVLFIGGIQLIGIGIIGEYVSRISDNVRQRPLYIIREESTSRS